jgi:hypothetical protein
MAVNAVILTLSTVMFAFFAVQAVRLLRATRCTRSKPTSFIGNGTLQLMFGLRLQP